MISGDAADTGTTGPLYAPTPTPKSVAPLSKGTKIAIGVIVPIVVITATLLALFLLLRRKRAKRSSPSSEPWAKPELDGTPSAAAQATEIPLALTAMASDGLAQPHPYNTEIDGVETRPALSEGLQFDVYEMPENARESPAELEGRGRRDEI